MLDVVLLQLLPVLPVHLPQSGTSFCCGEGEWIAVNLRGMIIHV